MKLTTGLAGSHAGTACTGGGAEINAAHAAAFAIAGSSSWASGVLPSGPSGCVLLSGVADALPQRHRKLSFSGSRSWQDSRTLMLPSTTGCLALVYVVHPFNQMSESTSELT